MLTENDIEKMESFEDFDNFPVLCSSKSILSKYWFVNSIKPVMFMLIYNRAKPKGDFALYLIRLSQNDVIFLCGRPH